MSGFEQPSMFRHAVTRSGTAATVVASGEIDLLSSPELRQVLHDLVDDGVTRIVVDLGAVTFVDSSGLGVLVGTMRRIHEVDDGGTLSVRGLTGPVRRVFDITGLGEVFETGD